MPVIFTLGTTEVSLALKVLAALVVVLVLLVGSGVTGLTFYLWPTSWGDRPVQVTPQMVAELSKLQSEKKFFADPEHFYFGAPSDAARLAAQSATDQLIAALLLELPRSPRRSTVLRVVKVSLATFPSPESEERDRFLVYVQRILVILAVTHTSELLNVWRYGFPYGWVFRA